MVVTIINAQVRTKLNNFIKTCDSLLVKGKDINKTSMSINAFKVLRSFLKKEADYNPIYIELDTKNDILAVLEFTKNIVANNFTYIADDVIDSFDEEYIEYKYHVGDIVSFGRKSIRQEEKYLEWRVIKVEGDKALLISTKAILFEPFDNYGDTDWINSSLKHKLNEQWIHEVFSDGERDNIITFSSEEDRDAQGKIFILSNEEIEELLPGIENRKDKISTWWTSSRDDTGENLCFVQRNGEVKTIGIPATKKIGVRPVLWVLNPIIKKDLQETQEILAKTAKKIIIVIDGDDYYIAEAEKDEDVNSNLLRKFSKYSTHYKTLQEAEFIANKLVNIYSSKYDIELTNVVLADLINKEYEIANRKYILKDKDDNHIACVDSKGNISFPFRECDADCINIDKVGYQIELDKIIEEENYNLTKEFDYFTIGKIAGYKVALNCDAPHIRYEIFKAESIIESYDEFSEIRECFEDDEKYYKGYIEALDNGLSIQRNFIYDGFDWSIEIVDLRSQNAFAPILDKKGDHNKHGHYVVNIYNEVPTLNFNSDLRYVVVALVDKNSSMKKYFAHRDVEAALCLPKSVPLVFAPDRTKTSKTNFIQLIGTVLNAQVSLGAGDSTYTIDPKFVPALTKLKEFFEEDDIEDNDNSSESNENFFIEREEAIDLRDSDDDDSIKAFQYKNSKTLTSIKLPNKLKIIPEGLFMNCTSLDYVTLPNTIEKIGDSAFEGCSAIWKLFLPDTVKTIGSRAFFGCNKLKRIYLPSNLEEIGSEAFSGCSKLTKIYFPESIKYIADDAFDDCISLKRIKVPYGVNLPNTLLEKVNVDYYTKEQVTDTKPNAEKTEKVILDEDTEDEVHSEDIKANTSLLLNNVLELLEYYDITTTPEIGSILNLLKKEYEND